MIEDIIEYKWRSVKNPRKKNGDLGDLKCNWCGCQTGAYIYIVLLGLICKGCLLNMIKDIDKTILSDLERIS